MTPLPLSLFVLAIPGVAAAQQTCAVSPDPGIPCCVVTLEETDAVTLSITTDGPRIDGAICDGVAIPASALELVSFAVISDASDPDGFIGRIEAAHAGNGSMADVLKWRIFEGQPILRTPHANIIIDITAAGLRPEAKFDVKVRTSDLRGRYLVPPDWTEELSDPSPTLWWSDDIIAPYAVSGPVYPAGWE